jgi:hypothetical protein
MIHWGLTGFAPCDDPAGYETVSQHGSLARDSSRMESDIGRWSPQDREALATYLGESPETVFAVHALRSGLGRAWVSPAARMIRER